MKCALRIYSDILQLRTEAFVALKHARGGMRYAVRLFVIVTLTAGAGIWIGLPALLQKPLLVERIDQVSALVDRFDREVVPTLNASLDTLSRDNLSIALGDLVGEGGEISADVLSNVINQAGITRSQFADMLSAEAAGLSEEARAELDPQVDSLGQSIEDRGIVTPEQIEQLLAQSTLAADQIAALVIQASTTQGQMDRPRAQATQQTPQLGQLLAQFPLSTGQVQDLLARLAFSSERLSSLTLQLGLTTQQIERLRADMDAAPEEVKGVLAKIRAGVEQFHPPLGSRFSRFVHMLGEWLSTPVKLLAQWAFLGLLLLVVAKLLGGRGTLRQHLTALLLASAPLFLLFFTYVPDVTPALPLTFNLAFSYFGRTLALLATAWAFLILLKSLSVTHEISMWRSLGAVVMTWAVIYVIFPVLSFASLGYILRG